MINFLPAVRRFAPCAGGGGEDIVISLDCLEAIRLADLEGIGMEEGAMRMGVSRHTFSRMLRRGRHLIAVALWQGRPISMAGGSCAFYENEDQRREQMSDSILVAVPSEAPGGLDATPSAHFGHCAAYTVARVEDGKIVETRVEENKGHEHGGCVQPVQELARAGVTALLAGGMGMRPLNAMREAGIKVYYSAGFPTVKAALEAFSAGRLQAFGTDQLCRGNCGHHHG